MSAIAKTLCGVALAGLLASPVAAQGLVTHRDLSLAMAEKMADAALAECKSKGYDSSVAVLDRDGQTLVLMRGEHQTAQDGEMARRKAYTALMFRRPSSDFAKRTYEDKTLMPQRQLADIVALSGGVPVKLGDQTIGAVGSAGSSQETGELCASAGIAAVAGELK